MVYRGKIHNGQVVFDGAERLPEGADVRVELVEGNGSENGIRVGSAEAVLKSAGAWAGEDEEVDRLLAELREMKRAEVERQLREPEPEL